MECGARPLFFCGDGFLQGGIEPRSNGSVSVKDGGDCGGRNAFCGEKRSESLLHILGIPISYERVGHKGGNHAPQHSLAPMKLRPELRVPAVLSNGRLDRKSVV